MRTIKILGLGLQIMIAIAVLPLRVIGTILGAFGLLSGSPVAVLASADLQRRRR